MKKEVSRSTSYQLFKYGTFTFKMAFHEKNDYKNNCNNYKQMTQKIASEVRP